MQTLKTIRATQLRVGDKVALVDVRGLTLRRVETINPRGQGDRAMLVELENGTIEIHPDETISIAAHWVG